jgi:hypothetical protein
MVKVAAFWLFLVFGVVTGLAMAALLLSLAGISA